MVVMIIDDDAIQSMEATTDEKERILDVFVEKLDAK